MKTNIVLFITLFTLTSFAVADEWQRTSPFRDVKIQGSYIFVDFEGAYYQVKEIDGHTALEIIKAAKSKFNSNWKRRLIEELPEVLEAAGSEPSTYKSLLLKELGTESMKRVSRAKFTSRNRQEVMRRKRLIE